MTPITVQEHDPAPRNESAPDRYRPSAAVSYAAKHIFFELTPSHEFLFDSYRPVPGSQLVSLPADSWWPDEHQLDYLARSLHPGVRSLTFLTLERFLYNPNSRMFSLFAQKTPLPILGILHRLPQNSEQKERLRNATSSIRTMLVLSEEMAKELRAIVGPNVDIAYLPHHPTALPFLNESTGALHAELGSNRDETVVSMLGEARKGKGLDLLLSAMERIPETERRKLFFLFAGKATDISPEHIAKHLSAAGYRFHLDLRSPVGLTGHAAITDREFAQYVIATGIGLLIYQDGQRDCMSGVLPNYVWARKPVIATQNSIVGREVTKHDLGLTIGDETPDALAQALVVAARKVRGDWTPSPDYEAYRATLAPESVAARLEAILQGVTGKSAP